MKSKDIPNFEPLLETAEDNAVTDWDMNFVQDMMDRYKKYGDETYVSESQLEQLERIAGE